jgi:GT2 family glycosyltransferase
VKIDVRIPFEPGGKLGEDYNRVMRETPHDWVLLLDHDVILSVNPIWYWICQQAIQNHRFGMATCYTNAPHNTGQQWPEPADDCVADHRDIARRVYDRNGLSITPLEKASGFFMLLSKAAWKKAGGFPGAGMFREDWDFCKRLKKAGQRIVRMDGLYVYHAKFRQESWEPSVEVTLDVKRREVKKK